MLQSYHKQAVELVLQPVSKFWLSLQNFEDNVTQGKMHFTTYIYKKFKAFELEDTQQIRTGKFMVELL